MQGMMQFGILFHSTVIGLLFLLFNKSFDPLDILMAWLCAINTWAFLAMFVDKIAKEYTQWRIHGNTLLFFGMFGALPGLWLGGTVFKHKTKNHSFGHALRLLFLLQILVLAWYFSTQYESAQPDTTVSSQPLAPIPPSGVDSQP